MKSVYKKNDFSYLFWCWMTAATTSMRFIVEKISEILRC
jgi:hypothetical protein